jgi:hypothetical protein
MFKRKALLLVSAMLLKASKSDPPVGSIIVCKVVEGNKVKVDWGTETSLDIGDGVVLSTGASIIRWALIGCF